MTLDLTQFHDAFHEESFEAIDSMEGSLLQLDVGAPDPELINSIFRVAHSIKGGAATFGFSGISSFTHTLETLLDELRNGRMPITAGLMDLLLKSVDVLRELLRAQRAQQPVDAQRVADLQFDLELAVSRNGVADRAVPRAARVAPASLQPAAAPVPAVESAGARAGVQGFLIRFKPMLHLLARGNDPLRIFAELRQLGELHVEAEVGALPPLAQLDPENCHLAWTLELETAAPRAAVVEVFDWAEGDCELVIESLVPDADGGDRDVAASPGSAAAVHGTAARDGHGAEVAKAADTGSIRVSIAKIDHLMNCVSELVITQSMLGQFTALSAGAPGERLRNGLAQLERNVRELQDSVMRVRMVPISFVFGRFPRMVRDLGRRLGKQIELRMTGGDTELDKTVLEKIGDPLVHLVRNSIDHGVETPEVRVAAGKPPTGGVHLHAYHAGGDIVVEVRDDGGGLRTDRILDTARARGLVGADATLDEQQIHQLIFMAGLSTADGANDISGRGVGMDVVRRNVEDLGGSIEVRSESGRGACFTVRLPLTLAIVDGQTVAVGPESYIVPLTAIVESLSMRTAAINRVGGRGELLCFRGDYLPVVRLDEVFRTPRSPDGTRGNGLVMVVEGDGRRIGLCVDELLGQQQVVVKTLEDNYGHVEGIAGATILGDGAVALILDIAGLARAVTTRAAA